MLLRDKAIHRNSWPLGIVEESFPSADKVVRKVRFRVQEMVVIRDQLTNLFFLFLSNLRS